MSSTMSSTTMSTLRAALSKVIVDHLDNDTDDKDLYTPLLDGLVEAAQQVIADMKAEHAIAIKKLVPSQKTKAVKTKTVKTTSNGGTKPANKYAYFVRYTAQFFSEDHPEVNGAQLCTPASNFANPGAACAKKYAASKDALDLEGKEMPLADLITTLKASFPNNMTVTGMVWGLLSKDFREQLAGSVTE